MLGKYGCVHLLGKEWICRGFVYPKYVLKEDALDFRLRGDSVPLGSGPKKSNLKNVSFHSVQRFDASFSSIVSPGIDFQKLSHPFLSAPFFL